MLFHCTFYRLRVERAAEDTTEDMNANNNSGRNLKVEALTTVRQLERFLAKSVARQWYDMERLSFNFVQKIKSDGPLTFTYDVSTINTLLFNICLVNNLVTGFIILLFLARF